MSRARIRVVPRLAAIATMAIAVLGFTAVASAHSLGSRVLRSGAKGSDVLALQSGLTKAGFTTRATGVYSGATATDIRRFQRFYKLKVTGAADVATIKTLHTVEALDAKATDTQSNGGSGLAPGAVKVKAKRHDSTRGNNALSKTIKSNPVLAPVARNGQSKHLGNRVLHPGMHGHDVRVLQAYLTVDGYPTGGIDGDYGPETAAAVRSWENANGYKANGIISYAQSRKLRVDVAKVEASAPKAKKGKHRVGITNAPTATINANGTADAPASAPKAVKTMIAAANSIDSTSYCYAGGHGSWKSSCYDCSGAVGFVLHAAGYLSSPEPSGSMESWGVAGRGRWVTVFANAGHAWMVIAGRAFDTAQWGPTAPAGSGPRWLDAANT